MPAKPPGYAFLDKRASEILGKLLGDDKEIIDAWLPVRTERNRFLLFGSLANAVAIALVGMSVGMCHIDSANNGPKLRDSQAALIECEATHGQVTQERLEEYAAEKNAELQTWVDKAHRKTEVEQTAELRRCLGKIEPMEERIRSTSEALRVCQANSRDFLHILNGDIETRLGQMRSWDGDLETAHRRIDKEIEESSGTVIMPEPAPQSTVPGPEENVSEDSVPQ